MRDKERENNRNEGSLSSCKAVHLSEEGVFGCSGASPGDAEADGAHVRQHIVEEVIASSSGLQVDIELGELQLDVIDVMEEQHQNPYIVVSGRQGG